MCARSAVAAVSDRRSTLGERCYNYTCNCPYNLRRRAHHHRFIFGELDEPHHSAKPL